MRHTASTMTKYMIFSLQACIPYFSIKSTIIVNTHDVDTITVSVNTNAFVNSGILQSELKPRNEFRAVFIYFYNGLYEFVKYLHIFNPFYFISFDWMELRVMKQY